MNTQKGCKKCKTGARLLRYRRMYPPQLVMALAFLTTPLRHSDKMRQRFAGSPLCPFSGGCIPPGRFGGGDKPAPDGRQGVSANCRAGQQGCTGMLYLFGCFFRLVVLFVPFWFFRCVILSLLVFQVGRFVPSWFFTLIFFYLFVVLGPPCCASMVFQLFYTFLVVFKFVSCGGWAKTTGKKIRKNRPTVDVASKKKTDSTKYPTPVRFSPSCVALFCSSLRSR